VAAGVPLKPHLPEFDKFKSYFRHSKIGLDAMRITGSLLLLCVTSAFPSYRTKIPNGMERGDLSVSVGCIKNALKLRK
jgi:hypothetical protein